ncbi:hypothetical protein NE237_019088 [Protea cynaroides]|uniref:Peptidase S8/S53 domain-containing protein n=1 Tax=Protea cynaroides TaxID=273540 RepID=A0A9Q0KB79_9MAGN|nr:hypothetical protein NE237_019088 [Protea cynaroides]
MHHSTLSTLEHLGSNHCKYNYWSFDQWDLLSECLCEQGALDASKVKKKIIFCDPGGLANVFSVEQLGPIGTIMAKDNKIDGRLVYSTSYALPSSVIAGEAVGIIHGYINSTRNPEATILKSLRAKRKAPFLTTFSSRGPNKSDLTAPGAEIIAAWSIFVNVNDDPLETRKYAYNVKSGTSMACPHVAAAAVYVKSFHLDWSSLLLNLLS